MVVGVGLSTCKTDKTREGTRYFEPNREFPGPPTDLPPSTRPNCLPFPTNSCRGVLSLFWLDAFIHVHLHKPVCISIHAVHPFMPPSMLPSI